MKEKLLISFTGGETSAYMAYWLLKNKSNLYDMIVVFANTGKERQETLDFINQCDKQLGLNTVWVEAIYKNELEKSADVKIASYETASRNGQPFEGFIQRHGIPNINNAKCARELKAYVTRAYARSLGWKKYYTAIGIRSDEQQRINREIAKKEKIIYPLVQMIKASKDDIALFWERQTFSLGLISFEGGCDLCWRKSLRKLMAIVSKRPELADWWKEMEQKYGMFLPAQRGKNSNQRLPVRFYKDFLSIDNISSELQFSGNLIANFNQQSDSIAFMDLEDAGCSDSCEIY